MPENQTLAPAFPGFRRQPGGNFAFTMIPNQFLDEIVPFEKPCVTKVVCLILRRTLGWLDEKGQRRTQDQVSYSEFAREMNMSTQAVADGLRLALEKGYIVRVKPGTKSGQAEGAWYSLRWAKAEGAPSIKEKVETPPSSEIEITPAQSKKESGPSSDNQSGRPAKPALIIRDMINKAESSKNKTVEIKASSTVASGKTGGRYSAYIGNVITEIGEQFGDSEHRLANIKRALNLWQKQPLEETEFVRRLYQARDKTRTCASGHRSPGKRGPSTRPADFLNQKWVNLAGVEAIQPVRSALEAKPSNRMPYFFRVLENLLNGSDRLPSTPSKKPVSKKNRAEKLTGPVETSLLPPQEKEAKPVSESEYISPQPLKEARTEAPVSKVNVGWAERWSVDSAAAIARWERVQAQLKDPAGLAVANRVIGIEGTLARPELLDAVDISLQFEGNNNPRKEEILILVCRNAFEARHVLQWQAGLQAAAEAAWGRPLTCQVVHL